MSIMSVSMTIKAKYGGNARLCYMDTDNFIAHANQKISIKTLLKILTPQTTKSRDSYSQTKTKK